MPPSGSIFVESVFLWLIVLTLFIGGIVHLAGRSASSVMAAVAIVFVISSPFFFYYRLPIHGHSPAYGDAALGWPLTYAVAESDSGVVGFRCIAFFTDLALGFTTGVFYLFLRHSTTHSGEWRGKTRPRWLVFSPAGIKLGTSAFNKNAS